MHIFSSQVVTIFFLVSIITTSQSTALFSPITKDGSTNLYSMLVYLKTPLQPSKLHVDLGSYLPWYDCTRHYKSSSYQPVLFNSSLCTDIDPKVSDNCFQPPGPGCSNDSCSFFPENPVTRKISGGNLLTDKFTLLKSNNPARPGPISEIVLSCTTAPNSDFKIFGGLAKGSNGLASLGRFNYSLSAQISRFSGSPWIFALCLPGSTKEPGLVAFNSPISYKFSNGIDITNSLSYTPLLLGPQGADTQIFFWYKSPDYYIALTSFNVNGKSVTLNQTLLAIDSSGRGGTKLSTSQPYTVLQSTIFKALANAFLKESKTMNLKVVKSVAPFSLCYAADGVSMINAGPNVPTVDLVMESGKAIWRIYGSNSMVRVRSGDVDAWCLGFVDGGVSTRTSIVIGGYQFEDNLLEFDLEKERLGFSSSLLLKSTKCANFKF